MHDHRRPSWANWPGTCGLILAGLCASLLPAGQAIAQAPDTPLMSVIPPGHEPQVYFRGSGRRDCPHTHVLVGIRHDQGELLCMSISTGNVNPPHPNFSFRTDASAFESSGAGRQWPSGADPVMRTANYAGPSMLWCGAGNVMTGYDASRNALYCKPLGPKSAGDPGPAPLTVLRVDGPASTAGPGHTLSTHSYTDRHGRQNSMHVCPRGWALMGLHLQANLFLCGLVYPPAANLTRSALDIDGQWRRVGYETPGLFRASDGRLTPFVDTLRQLHKFSTSTQCTSATANLTLTDRFLRTVTVAHNNRGAVALRGGAGNSTIRWRCGFINRQAFSCPADANVLDVARYNNSEVELRCLRRTPAPWTR